MKTLRDKIKQTGRIKTEPDLEAVSDAALSVCYVLAELQSGEWDANIDGEGGITLSIHEEGKYTGIHIDDGGRVDSVLHFSDCKIVVYDRDGDLKEAVK